ncbi:hypothetical protein [Lactobacillus sp. ESL0677]|uniref:hypothetical protein n=1 Tax=Lactobacillus sp. ESL0677 TaxID=2983208 RepID=UPI0023F730B3|nr:hypothetical protein [Lactobacillus sp. ESL0677]WEV37170.1 hypothetical protein OZX76_00880 [Lactobacillus sp. ESL0677]
MNKFYKKLLAAITTFLTIFALSSGVVNAGNSTQVNQSNSVTIVKAASHRTAKRSNRKTYTVYIATMHGKKYHSSRNCRTLKRSRGHIKKISLSRAKKLGYTPCKVCY